VDLPGMAKMEEIFLSKAKDWADMVKDKDKHSFADRMRLLECKFRQEDPGFTDAYNNVYRLLGEG
jgi:hypothetical protein